MPTVVMYRRCMGIVSNTPCQHAYMEDDFVHPPRLYYSCGAGSTHLGALLHDPDTLTPHHRNSDRSANPVCHRERGCVQKGQGKVHSKVGINTSF